MARESGNKAVSGCASGIAGLILCGIGFMLLLFVPIVGVIFFGILIIVVLLRVLLR